MSFSGSEIVSEKISGEEREREKIEGHFHWEQNTELNIQAYEYFNIIIIFVQEYLNWKNF